MHFIQFTPLLLSVKSVLGDLTQDASDEELVEVSRESSKSALGKQPQESSLFGSRRKPSQQQIASQNGSRRQGSQGGDGDEGEGTNLPSRSLSGISLHELSLSDDAGTQGDMQAFLPRSPLKVH